MRGWEGEAKASGEEEERRDASNGLKNGDLMDEEGTK